MLCLEGCDGSGKTTLANQLAEELGWTVWHSGAPTTGYLEMWLKPIVEHPNQDLILDRWHLGDLVYGELWRGKTLSRQEFMAIEMALQVRGATLIHVYTSTQSAAQVIKDRGDDLVGPDEVADHIEAFKVAVTKSILPLLHYSHERLDVLPLEEIIVRHEEANAYRTAFPSMPGVGSLHPTWIFVGERPNALRVKEAMDIPFAVGSSGEWLIQALDELDLTGQIYLTNAIKSTGNQLMIAQEVRWLQRFGNPQVVALGSKAASILDDHRIPHYLALHPSYMRRFHFNESYAMHLSEAMT